MWSSIAKWAVKIALYAAGHQDELRQVVEEVIKVKSDLSK